MTPRWCRGPVSLEWAKFRQPQKEATAAGPTMFMESEREDFSSGGGKPATSRGESSFGDEDDAIMDRVVSCALSPVSLQRTRRHICGKRVVGALFGLFSGQDAPGSGSGTGARHLVRGCGGRLVRARVR